MEYKAIDSHCHPQFPQYDQDREEIIERALKSGVGMVCVGTDPETSASAVALADGYEGLWASVGQHPNHELDKEFDVSKIESLLTDAKVVAIGEIGLDYFRVPEQHHKIQAERFMIQFELAQAVGKPVIIHCRDAHEDMLKLLPAKDNIGIIHSFNGTKELADEYMKRGFFIGLNAIVTYSKQYQEMLCHIPLDRLLLETDAPYLAPAPYRGQRNEPVYILETARLIANTRGLSEDLLASSVANAKTLYNI